MLKILFASPFELHSTEKTGVTLISRDNGMTWQEGARFFRSTDIAPWEVRSVELPSGRILLVFWAFDLKNQQHLCNHVVYSDDGGMSWSDPIDTTLRGQASNWMALGDKVALLQARREGDAPGLYLNIVEDFDGSRFRFSQDICLWDVVGGANRDGNIEQQFAALKFGQPSALKMDDGSWLLLFWQMADEEYTVQCWKIRFTD